MRPSFQEAASPQLRRVAEQAQEAANALQMQARDAWKKVDNAEKNARAIDGQANQAVSSADKAKKDLHSFGAAVMSNNMAEGTSASASATATATRAVPPVTYSASAAGAGPVAPPAVLNSIGQPIGALVSMTA